MNKSKKPHPETLIQQPEDRNEKHHSTDNPLSERFDEGDPLHDRTPTGDAGPEENNEKKGPAPESKTFY